jgi:hypothetical protein
VTSAFRLTDAERAGRYDLLVRATTLLEPPVLSEAGLRLLLDSATAPQLAEMLPEQSRPQLERLIAAGLVGADGRLVQQAADVVEVIRRPAIWLEIEAIAGRQPGSWRAWLSDQLAVIVTASSEADEYALLTAIPGWVPVAAVRWLGIGPRDTLAGRPVLSMTTLLGWLREPDSPLPGDDPVLAQIGAQPGQLWAIDVEPGGGRALVLDATDAGLWLVTADDTGDGAVLVPLPPQAFWRLLLTLIARASDTATTSNPTAVRRNHAALLRGLARHEPRRMRVCGARVPLCLGCGWWCAPGFRWWTFGCNRGFARGR